MKNLVVIPTYNERDNIQALIEKIFENRQDLSILVVDDSSPDGTAEVVKEMSTTNDRVHLLLREKKEGLGRAYLAGFQWGLDQGFETITEMDADFSHRPQDLVKVIAAVEGGAEFAIGSRYVDGGGTENWGLGRKIISRGGSLYSAAILGFPLGDWTGGFNCWSRKALEGLGLSSVSSEGYCFQIELKYRALKKGFKGVEVPIIFEERREGQSKMSTKIVVEAFYKVWLLRFSV